MKYLGVEFYRNFVGIEKPLKVAFSTTNINKEPIVLDLEMSYINTATQDLVEHGVDVYHMEQCKPYLRTIEDLSDEELLYFYYGDSIPESAITKRINGIAQIVDFGYEEEYGNVEYIHRANDIIKCDNDQFNRLYSMHCHLKAKEYIDNGLALRYKDLVE